VALDTTERAPPPRGFAGEARVNGAYSYAPRYTVIL